MANDQVAAPSEQLRKKRDIPFSCLVIISNLKLHANPHFIELQYMTVAHVPPPVHVDLKDPMQPRHLTPTNAKLGDGELLIAFFDTLIASRPTPC